MRKSNEILSSAMMVILRICAVFLAALILLMDAAAFIAWLMIGIFDDKWNEITVQVLFVCVIVSFLAFLFVCALFGLARKLESVAQSQDDVRVLSDFGQLIDTGWDTGLKASSNVGVVVLAMLVIMALAFWKDFLWWSSFGRGMRASQAHRFDEAKQFLQRSAEVADEERKAISLFLLASNSVEAKKYAEATRQFAEAITEIKAVPQDHRTLEVAACQGLARAYIEQGRLNDAKETAQRCIEIFSESDKPLRSVQIRVLGPWRAPSSGDAGPTLAGSYSLLEEILIKQGNFTDAQKAFKSNLSQFENQAKPSLREMIIMLDVYAQLLDNAVPAHPDMVTAAYSDAEELLIDKYGEDSLEVVTLGGSYGDRLSRMRLYAQAEKTFDKALSRAKKVIGNDHALMLRINAARAANFADMGEYVKAEALFKETLAAYEAKKDKSADGQIQLDSCQSAYAKMLKKLGREDEARKLDPDKVDGEASKAVAPNTESSPTAKSQDAPSESAGSEKNDSTQAEQLARPDLPVRDREKNGTKD